MAHEDHRQASKQHALRRDVYRPFPLWVYDDDDDWNLMHGDNKLPPGDLICPEPGCRAELVAVERKTGTRFLRNRPRTSDCGHAFGRSRGGGPPSREHRWLQQRLAMLCGTLGYEAVQEHYESRADVWVRSTPPLAIEMQRWNTSFASRTAARQAKGASVLWLLPESASSQKAGRELFRRPAARIRVMHREDRTKEAKPWEPGHSGKVLLWVGATVMQPSDDGSTLVSAGNYDARTFLREVLEGERRWYGPNAVGFKFGSGWARPGDVDLVRSARRSAITPRPIRAAVPAMALEDPPSEKPTPPVQEQSAPTGQSKSTPTGSATPTFDPAASIAEPDVAHEVRPPVPTVPHVATRTGWLQRLKNWLTTG